MDLTLHSTFKKPDGLVSDLNFSADKNLDDGF
jgi:hypothetical protein